MGPGPAWGAMIRMNPATGNGVVLTVSGGIGSVDRLVHDWVWWETGAMTFEGRRQLVQSRAVPALAAIVVGAVAMVLWRHRPSRRDRLQPLA